LASHTRGQKKNLYLSPDHDYTPRCATKSQLSLVSVGLFRQTTIN